jgi:thiamine biosynthesis lipoprotein
MGTIVEMGIFPSTEGDPYTIWEGVKKLLSEGDLLLSTYREDSLLYQWNRNTSSPPPEPLVEPLKKAWECSVETEGTFFPGIRILKRGRGNSGKEKIPFQNLPNPNALIIESALKIARKGEIPPIPVDEGGWGKGWILFRVEKWIQSAFPYMEGWINMGGQVALFLPNRRPIPLLLRDPFSSEKIIGTVYLSTSLHTATSSQGERGRWVDGKWVGHIVDPKTGVSVPHYGSVTVIGPDPLKVDCYSTALFVMGRERGVRWIQGKEGYSALFYERGKFFPSHPTFPILRAIPLSQEESFLPFPTSPPGCGN